MTKTDCAVINNSNIVLKNNYTKKIIIHVRSYNNANKICRLTPGKTLKIKIIINKTFANYLIALITTINLKIKHGKSILVNVLYINLQRHQKNVRKYNSNNHNVYDKMIRRINYITI